MTMPTFDTKPFPELPSFIATTRHGVELFDRIQMQQYAMQYLDLHVGLLTDAFKAGKAAQVEQEPVGYFYKDERGFWNQAGDPMGFPAMTKLYAAPPAPAVPDGWKLVPITPTPKMIHAAYTDRNGNFGSESQWAAMLAASPEPTK